MATAATEEEEVVEGARGRLEAVTLSGGGDEPSVAVRVFVGDEPIMEADRSRLERHSEFFRALYSFSDCPGEGEVVDLSCDVDPAALRWIVAAVDSGGGSSTVRIGSLEQAYNILRGSAYLQCGLSEALAGQYLLSRLQTSNCFTVALWARENGCAGLYTKVEEDILSRLATQTFRPESLTEDFFRLDLEGFRRLIDEEMVDNELAFFSLFGWVSFRPEVRRWHLRSLLDLVVLELMDPEVIQKATLKEDYSETVDATILGSIQAYGRLSLQERISYWANKKTPPKWPKMQVICSAGYFEKLISCRCPPEGRWLRLTAKPEKLLSKSLGSRMVAVGSVLYFIGGDGNESLWAYDITVDKWKMVSAGQTCRIRPSVASLEGKIYVFGGSCNMAGMLETAECFDAETQRWSMLMPLSTCRMGAETAVYAGKIYLFGGIEKRRPLTSVVAYDPVADDYEDVADIPKLVGDFGICVAGSKVYLVGGLDPITFLPVAFVLAFDFLSRTWEELPSLLTPRKSCACFYDGVHLHASGGWTDMGSGKPPPCERFNFNLNTWETVGQHLPKPLRTSVVPATVHVPLRIMDNFWDLGASNYRVKRSSGVKKDAVREQKQERPKSAVETFSSLFD